MEREKEEEEEDEEGRAVCTADMMNQISGRHDHDHHKAHSRDSVRFTTRQIDRNTLTQKACTHSHDGAPDKSLHTVNSPALSAAESDGDYVNTEAAVIAPCVAPVLEVRHILDS